MRKPRDIPAELKALSDKAKYLKAKHLVQLGELVTITGADALDLETLTGALLAAASRTTHSTTKEAWRTEGAAFFSRRQRRKAPSSAGADSGHGQSVEADDCGAKTD